jgi:hypothetical protein
MILKKMRARSIGSLFITRVLMDIYSGPEKGKKVTF